MKHALLAIGVLALGGCAIMRRVPRLEIQVRQRAARFAIEEKGRQSRPEATDSRAAIIT